MKIKSKLNVDKYDNYLADAASFIFGKLFIVSVIGGVCNRIGLRGQGIDIIITDVLYAIILFRIIKVIRTRFTIDMLIIILFFIVSICFTLLFYLDNAFYLYNGIANIFFYCIPGYLIFRSIIDLDAFINRLRYGMYVVFGLGTIYFFGYSLRNNMEGLLQYDMSFSYTYVVPVLFFIYWGIKRKSIIHYIIACFGTVLIIIQGSRGALLCIVVYILLYLLKGNIKLGRKILYISIIAISSATLWTYRIQIGEYLNEILIAHGTRSRTIDYIISNTISNSNGRDAIASDAMNYILNNNLFGLGLYGDRVVLGTYPHNIFLELLMHLVGLLVGV